MSELALHPPHFTSIEVRVSDKILQMALRSILDRDTSLCLVGSASIPGLITVTDDLCLASANSILIVGESDMAAARAMSLINAGRLGSACPRDLIHCVPSLARALDAGCVALPSQLTSRARRAPELSEDLFKVLNLVRAGKTNPQIARQLNCSIATVKRRVGDLLMLLGAANRIELLRTQHN